MGWEPLTKPLGAVVGERLASPLVGSFAISWLLINWKFVVALLSQASVSKTYEIFHKLYPTDNEFYGWLIAAPMASALAYIFLLPYLSRPATRYWRETLKALEDDRKEVEQLELLEIGQSRQIQAENRTLRNSNEELTSLRDEAVDKVKGALQSAFAAEVRRDELQAHLTAVSDQLAVAQGEVKDLTIESQRFSSMLELTKEARDRLILLYFGVTSAEWKFATHQVNYEYDPRAVFLYIAMRKSGVVPSPLTFSEVLAMSILAKTGPSTPKQIADYTAMIESVAILTLRRLESGGYLVPERIAIDDSRQYSFTPEGLVLANKISEYEQSFSTA